eukprot:gene8638-14654_t
MEFALRNDGEHCVEHLEHCGTLWNWYEQCGTFGHTFIWYCFNFFLATTTTSPGLHQFCWHWQRMVNNQKWCLEPSQKTYEMVRHEVIIRYGPYQSCHLVKHTEDRLDGLQYILKEDGHSVSVLNSEEWNVVELIVHEEVVFRCQIQELDFGGDGKLDPLCLQALAAVQKAY